MPRARPVIVVIGSINTDFVCRTPYVPAPGETVLGSDLVTVPGGKGANQAVAAARLAGRLGPRVHLIGRVGDDPAGRRLRDGLKRDGVDVTHVRITAGVSSGCALILVDPRGENSIVVSPGANARVTPADIDAAAPLIRGAAVVLLQLEIPPATVRHAIALCRRLGVRTILDPAPVPVGTFSRAFYAVDFLTPNELESFQIAGLKPTRTGRVSEPQRVGAALLSRGALTVLLKLGARGAAIVARGANVRIVRPDRVRVVDSTAAGDAFNGALGVALAEGMEIEAAVKYANAAGALCCTAFGARPSLPTRRDIDRFMHRTGRGRH